MRFLLIGCEVLLRELCHAVARSPHQVDVQFLPKGLHDLGGPGMRKKMQEQIDAVDCTNYDAILLGYALCGNGLAEITAPAVPLVLPRAHDCIALLLGSRARYQELFEANPGTYFRSTGWLERGKALNQSMLAEFRTMRGFQDTLEQWIAKYGEDDGRYLYEQMHAYEHNYRQLVYIETGLETGPQFETAAQEEATAKGWTYEKTAGSLAWFEALLSGNWSPDLFLVVPPGGSTAVTYDEAIVKVMQP